MKRFGRLHMMELLLSDMKTAGVLTLRQCGLVIFQGCSSGRLVPCGDYEPSGVALAYVAAGGPIVVANLWDITDKDIDRFSSAVLKRWLAKESSGSSGSNRPNLECMSTAVVESREVCRLPHLVGAAPVCYGLPAIVAR